MQTRHFLPTPYTLAFIDQGLKVERSQVWLLSSIYNYGFIFNAYETQQDQRRLNSWSVVQKTNQTVLDSWSQCHSFRKLGAIQIGLNVLVSFCPPSPPPQTCPRSFLRSLRPRCGRKICPFPQCIPQNLAISDPKF